MKRDKKIENQTMLQKIKKLILNSKLNFNFLKNLDLKISFSFFIFIGLLVLSWFYLSDSFKINSEEEVKHRLLQTKFQEALSRRIEENHPEVNHISFHRVWTKKTNDPSQVEIYFSYSLSLADGDSELEGSALLSRSQEKLWRITNFQVEKTHLEFLEPLVIKSPSENSSHQETN